MSVILVSFSTAVGGSLWTKFEAVTKRPKEILHMQQYTIGVRNTTG